MLTTGKLDKELIVYMLSRIKGSHLKKLKPCHCRQNRWINSIVFSEKSKEIKNSYWEVSVMCGICIIKVNEMEREQNKLLESIKSRSYWKKGKYG